jgi:hypothetical protein
VSETMPFSVQNNDDLHQKSDVSRGECTAKQESVHLMLYFAKIVQSEA